MSISFFRKLFASLSGLLVLSLVLIYLLTQSGTQAKEGNLEVVFLDVGQGDAILIKTPYDQQILIDGGPDTKVLQKLGQHLAFFDHDLDLMILTHPHADHVTGLVEVTKRYDIDQAWYTGALHTAGDYLAWLQALKTTATPLHLVEGPERVVFGPPPGETGEPVILEVIYPWQSFKDQRFKDLNDSSIVVRLTFGETAYLLMGDAPSEIESKLLASDFKLQADTLKVGHHGSTYSSSKEFLQAVQPQYAVIQSGAENSYGHPHRRVLKRLKSLGIKILRNDLMGDIVLVSNASEVNLR